MLVLWSQIYSLLGISRSCDRDWNCASEEPYKHSAINDHSLITEKYHTYIEQIITGILWSYFVTPMWLLGIGIGMVGLWLAVSNAWRCIRAWQNLAYSWRKLGKVELSCLLLALVLAVMVNGSLVFNHDFPNTSQVIEIRKGVYSELPSENQESLREINRARHYGPNEWLLFLLPVSLSIFPLLFIWSRWRSVLDDFFVVIIAIYALAFAAAGGLFMIPTDILILYAATLSRPVSPANKSSKDGLK